MRVLFVRRQSKGGLARASDALAAALEPLGVEAVIDDVESWVPENTGFWVDRKVSPRLVASVRGFDLVHAWGYRAAWACGEAFYIRFPWVYTAWDLPRTTNSLLIDRLNHARLGVCTSRTLRDRLDKVFTLNLEVVPPGVTQRQVIPKVKAREQLGISPHALVAACLSTSDRLERGLDAFLSAMASLPNVTGLTLTPAEATPNVFAKPTVDPWLITCSADVIVVPSRHASFSIAGLEAMHAEVPLVMRSIPGLNEMGVDGMQYHGFETDEQLADVLGAWASGERSLENTVTSAQARAQGWLGMEECARRHADLYRTVLRG